MWRVPAFLLLAALVGCFESTLDLTGKWVGNAHLTADGERKDVELRFDLTHSGDALDGTVTWDDYRRDITGFAVEGPQVRIESATENDTIVFNGLFRNEKLEGRFAIQYSVDPEPYPGRFSVTREE